MAVFWSLSLRAGNTDDAEKIKAYAKELNNKVMADYVKRSVRSGFNRAMLLFLMHGQTWTKELADFATWSVEYDLWVKWHVFRDRLLKANEQHCGVNSNNHPLSILPKLPQEFSIDLLRTLRPSSTDETINALIRQWKSRGKIEETTQAGIYKKSNA